MCTEEAERITQCNGRVYSLDDEPGVHRVWLPHEDSPGLAMSRAFGDYCVKDFGLISVPQVIHRHITSKDQFVVLATDGVCMKPISLVFKILLHLLIYKYILFCLQVWDVVSNEEAVQIVWECPERGKAAKRLVERAADGWRKKRRGIAMDDISAIVLFFHSSSSSSHQFELVPTLK